MNTPYRRKMATQITLYIALLLVVSIAIITGLLLNASFELVEEESLDKVYYLTTSITNEFNMSLQNVTDIGESLEGMIRKTYSHVDLNNARETYLDDLVESYLPHVSLLAQDFSIANTAYLYFNPELDGKPHDIYFVDDDQDGVVSRQEQLPVSYFTNTPSERGGKEWWFGPIESRSGYWTQPYYWELDDGSEIYFISYTRPVYMNNKLVAVVGTDFQYENIENILSKAEVYKSGYVFLIGDTNRFLIHPEYQQGDHMRKVNDPIFDELYEELLYNDSNMFEIAPEIGNEYLISYSKLSNDWVIGVVVPKSEMYGHTSTLYVTMVAMFIIGIPLLGYGAHYMAKHISKPIVEMTAAVEQIKSGNYYLKLDEKNLSRDDEIGVLCLAINDMRKSLLSSFDKITSQNDQLQDEINNRKQFQEQFELVYEAFSKAKDGLIITDSSFKVIYSNESMERITGFSQDDMIGYPLGKTIRVSDNSLWHDLIISGNWSGELDFIKRNNEKAVLNFTIGRIEEEGEGDKFIGILEDVTQTKKQEEDIDYLKRYDTLTGLPNKKEFLDGVYNFITDKEEDIEVGVLVIINIDDFRLINQAIGYEKANELIIEVAKRLENILGEDDLISRLNGDEFGLFIKDVDHLQDIESSIESIIDVLKEPLTLEERELYLTASVGVSIYPFDAEDEGNLFAFANSALTYAKSKGKNNFQYYSREMTEEAFEKYELTNSLRSALEEDQFYIDYQPQYHLSNQKITGTEALIRWRHPDKGIISPIKFIPLAESSGFINILGEWVLRKACLQIKKFHESGHENLSVAVNLSSIQLYQPDLVIRLKSILDEIDFDPTRLEIEITESIFMSKSHLVVENLTRIKDMGVRIAIDDFGTGFSSLSYLKDFKVDKLKIDRSFVKDIPDNDDGNIAKLIIDLSQSLGIDVIAEGTETMEQVNFMLENGCKQIQGYYFSKPIAPNELKKLLKKTNR